MSRKKIGQKKKKPAKLHMPEVTMMSAAQSHLQVSRAQRKMEEDSKVTELIKDGQLNLGKTHDYEYMARAAKGVGWSIGRLMKAVVRLTDSIKVKERQDEDDSNNARD